MKISPSVLACDFTKMGEEIVKVSNAGVDMIHLDIMDGNFVPNISFGPAIVKSLRKKTSLPFETHLMITNPLNYISEFIESGADIITFHLESDSNTMKTIEKIKSLKKKAGLSIKPKTPPKSLFPYLKYLDLVLIMTVEPGFGGQKFMENQLYKTTVLKQEIIRQNLSTLIEIDGGVNTNTIKVINSYPIDICVSGTCIFESDNINQTVKFLKLGGKF